MSQNKILRMIEEKKLISACSPLAEHLHFETRVVNINLKGQLTFLVVRKRSGNIFTLVISI